MVGRRISQRQRTDIVDTRTGAQEERQGEKEMKFFFLIKKMRLFVPEYLR